MNTDEEFGVLYAWREGSVVLQIPAKHWSGTERERGRVMDSDWKATHQSELGPG